MASRLAEAALGNPATRRLRIVLAYDGTGYAGWQIQPDRPSVQQRVETELRRLAGHPVKLHGSGRTDSGVHARAQVAHVDVRVGLSERAVAAGLNARLPPDIRVHGVRAVRGDFHARRDAVSKEYRYFLWNGPVMPPEKRLYAAHVRRPLALEPMRAAAAALEGEHDFSSFCANPDREVPSHVRILERFTVTRRGRGFTLRVRGNGFLYKMVRSLAGFLVKVGEGTEPPGAAREILDARARTARVPTAPPQGLFLWRVFYGSGIVRRLCK